MGVDSPKPKSSKISAFTGYAMVTFGQTNRINALFMLT